MFLYGLRQDSSLIFRNIVAGVSLRMVLGDVNMPYMSEAFDADFYPAQMVAGRGDNAVILTAQQAAAAVEGWSRAGFEYGYKGLARRITDLYGVEFDDDGWYNGYHRHADRLCQRLRKAGLIENVRKHWVLADGVDFEPGNLNLDDDFGM